MIYILFLRKPNPYGLKGLLNKIVGKEMRFRQGIWFFNASQRKKIPALAHRHTMNVIPRMRSIILKERLKSGCNFPLCEN